MFTLKLLYTVYCLIIFNPPSQSGEGIIVMHFVHPLVGLSVCRVRN